MTFEEWLAEQAPDGYLWIDDEITIARDAWDFNGAQVTVAERKRAAQKCDAIADRCREKAADLPISARHNLLHGAIIAKECAAAIRDQGGR